MHNVAATEAFWPCPVIDQTAGPGLAFTSQPATAHNYRGGEIYQTGCRETELTKPHCAAVNHQPENKVKQEIILLIKITSIYLTELYPAGA